MIGGHIAAKARQSGSRCFRIEASDADLAAWRPAPLARGGLCSPIILRWNLPRNRVRPMPHSVLKVPERGMLDAYEALLSARGFSADAAQHAAAERLQQRYDQLLSC